MWLSQEMEASYTLLLVNMHPSGQVSSEDGSGTGHLTHSVQAQAVCVRVCVCVCVCVCTLVFNKRVLKNKTSK